MPLTEFEGRHAPLFTEYVDFRVGLGFAVPASTRRILRHIADYLDELPPVPEVIDRERAEEICAAREGESDTTRQCRIVAVRMQFVRQPACLGAKTAVGRAAADQR